MDASKDELKQAIEAEHGGLATHHHAVPVNEKERGQSIWHGIVHVFDLSGHAKAKRAFAWSMPTKGEEKPRIVTMLQIPPVNGPIEAVRAALAIEHGGPTHGLARGSDMPGSGPRKPTGGPSGRNPSAPSRQRGRGSS